MLQMDKIKAFLIELKDISIKDDVTLYIDYFFHQGRKSQEVKSFSHVHAICGSKQKHFKHILLWKCCFFF